MKVFLAALATESNSFSAIPTSRAAFALGQRRGVEVFEDAFMFGPMARRLQRLVGAAGGEVIPSLFASAQPAGPTVQAVYEELRDAILDDLCAAGAVDIVILSLHGAMIAQETWDCEGDLLRRVRAIVGPGVPIGAVLDPHAHLTDEMIANATLLSFMKEYPHTDGLDRLEDVWRICLGVREGRLNPVAAVRDCRMVAFWPTQAQPMRGFVDRMTALEAVGGVLSISFVHGFPWGDTPVTGAKMLVYADGDPKVAAALAERLGDEIWNLREQTRMVVAPVDVALERVAQAKAGPIVLADIADNAGGGAPSDSTFLLRAVLDRGLTDVGFAIFFDPLAAAFCHEVGVGATIDLRIGGKLGATSGDPVDLRVKVMGLASEGSQTGLRGGVVPLGNTAWVRGAGVDLILAQERVQCFHPTAFSNLGLDPATLKAIVVKSTNHFRAGFDPIASEVIYVDTPGAIRTDFANILYAVFKAPYWPRDAWS
jgi:microcystin degradation protein MlrC